MRTELKFVKNANKLFKKHSVLDHSLDALVVKSHLARIKKDRSENLLTGNVKYVAPVIIKQISDQIAFKLTDKVAVFYTIEWAVELKARGINDVTLITTEYCETTAKRCSAMGLKYSVLKDIKTKFDVAVGNPPYDNGSKGKGAIWQKFIDVGLDIASTVALIVPKSMVSSDDYAEHRQALSERGLSHVVRLPNDAFEGAVVHTIYFIADGKGNLFKNDLAWVLDPTLRSIINKIEAVVGKNYYQTSAYSFKQPRFEANAKAGVVPTKLNNQGFITTSGKLDRDSDKYRVFTSYLANGKKSASGVLIHLTAVDYITPGMGLPPGYRYIVANNATEAKNLKQYLKTDFCSMIQNLTATSRSLDGPQTRFVPKMDMTKQWTDMDLYRTFNLSDDEINFIESNK